MEKILDLALDLDQTLIHAQELPLINRHSRKAKIYEQHELYLCKYVENDKIYFIYYRPGLFQFLAKANKKYNIYLYTYGAKEYAYHIAEHICNKMKCMLFSKIYTRDDFTNLKKKLFGCSDESNTVIVDDNPEYWDNYGDNLIEIEPYYGPFHTVLDDDELDRVYKKLKKILLVYEKCEIVDCNNDIVTCSSTDSDYDSAIEI